jgi:glycerophosphoryl diester phosphodiesterase
MVIAHRGYSQRAQENSLSAFDAAIKAGAKGIECDVRLTKDGKAIVYHDRYILTNGKKKLIHKHSLREIQNTCKSSKHKLLTLDDLFIYIAKRKNIHFFPEIKSSSLTLAEVIAKKIKQKNLWNRVHIIAFSSIAKNLLSIQAKYPRLKVEQLLFFPPYAYLKKPRKSHGIFLGWLDAWRGSQALFKMLLPTRRLIRLKKFLEKNGFNVKGGVINSDSGLELFSQAGITDIVTDRVAETVNYFKQKTKLISGKH